VAENGYFGFSALGFACRQKPNVPFAGRLFFYTGAQRVFKHDIHTLTLQKPLHLHEKIIFYKWIIVR